MVMKKKEKKRKKERKMNETNIGTGLTILQDTRNKRGKPVRIAFEKGCTANGAAARMQALPFGDYCLETDDIRKATMAAYRNRFNDIKGDPEILDLAYKIADFEGLPLDKAKETAFTLIQHISDNTHLIKRLNSLTKADLISRFSACVETKWRMSELDGCIDSYEFHNEIDNARRAHCRILVLVVTDRPHDYDRFSEVRAKINALGADFNMCGEDSEYGMILDYLLSFERFPLAIRA